MRKHLKTTIYYLLLVFITLFVVIALKLYVFSFFSIPSTSMSPTIIEGDHIWVSKLVDAPKVRNEVWVFHFPYTGKWKKITKNTNSFYVKRCIALPGDTLSIINSVYVVSSISDSLGYMPKQNKLRAQTNDMLKQQGVILRAFPRDTIYNWTIKDFGPLFIPKAGVTISIDTTNIKLYKNVIEYESGMGITVNSTVLLGSTPIDKYTFKDNYYFMAGDNVLDSKDSRYWGLLPEDFFVGKVLGVWKSKDPYTKSYRFNRFFKSVKLDE